MTECVFLQEIANVHAYYERIKRALSVSASVSVTPVNLTARLQDCALDFQQWRESLNVSVRRLAITILAHKSSSTSVLIGVVVTAKCQNVGVYLTVLHPAS